MCSLMARLHMICCSKKSMNISVSKTFLMSFTTSLDAARSFSHMLVNHFIMYVIDFCGASVSQVAASMECHLLKLDKPKALWLWSRKRTISIHVVLEIMAVHIALSVTSPASLGFIKTFGRWLANRRAIGEYWYGSLCQNWNGSTDIKNTRLRIAAKYHWRHRSHWDQYQVSHFSYSGTSFLDSRRHKRWMSD